MSVNYQVLLSNRDITPDLNKWQGNIAKVWSFTVSHSVLEIRVISELNPDSFLKILCGDVDFIHGPTMWSNCRFEVNNNNEGYILRDEGNGFEAHIGTIGVEEGHVA